MAWFYILFADVFEVAWPFILKWIAPLSRWAPLFVVIICAILANYLLAEAVKRLPAATVYATFVGIGTAGTAMVGMVFLARARAARRIAFVQACWHKDIVDRCRTSPSPPKSQSMGSARGTSTS